MLQSHVFWLEHHSTAIELKASRQFVAPILRLLSFDVWSNVRLVLRGSMDQVRWATSRARLPINGEPIGASIEWSR